MRQDQDPPAGAEASHLLAPLPTVPLGDWATMDADFGANPTTAAPPPTQLPTIGFSGRFWKVDMEQPSDLRVRWERPALLAWVLISCFWQGLIPWMALGLAMIAYAVSARTAFRRYGLVVQPWVYGAMGLGQIMLACSYAANLGPFWPFIGLYWLGVILTWGIVEVRGMLGKRRGGSIF